MAITIDQSFITQFSADVKQAYSLESRLFNVVRKRTGVVGNTSKFQVLGGVSAYTKTRNADLTALEPAHSQALVTLTDHYATALADDLDLLKTNIDIKREYTQLVGSAIARKIDELIITALTAGTVTATTNIGPMTLARLLEIKKAFDNAAVPATDRILVVGAATMEDLLNDNKIPNGDYNTVRALTTGQLDTFLGFKFITVPDSYLTLNATPTPDTRVNLAFHKDALGVAFGAEPKTSIEWSVDKHAWWVKCVMSMGAGIVDPTGCLKFEVDI